MGSNKIFLYGSNATNNTSISSSSIKLDLNFTDTEDPALDLAAFINNSSTTSSSVNNDTNTNITLSSLSSGIYSLYATANDTANIGFNNTSESYVIVVDTIAPVISNLSGADYNTTISNASWTSTISFTDNLYLTNYSFQLNTSTNATNYTMTRQGTTSRYQVNITLDINTNYTLIYYANDSAGNQNSTALGWIKYIAAASSGGGISSDNPGGVSSDIGGGGGGGGGGGTPLATESANFGDVEKGKETTVSFSDYEDHCLSEVSLVPKKELQNAIVKVTKLPDKPPYAPDPLVSQLSATDIIATGMTTFIKGGGSSNKKAVYCYMNIEPINFRSAEIEKTELEFTVDKNWLADKGFSGNDVHLLTYSPASGWQKLNTQKKGSIGNSFIYKAEAMHLSIFAIYSERSISLTATVSEGEPTTEVKNVLPIKKIAMPQIGVATKENKQALLFVMLAVVAVVFVVMLVQRREIKR